MNNNDERDYDEEQANQKLLQEGDESEKLFKYTLTFTAQVPGDDAYSTVEGPSLADDAAEVDIELPIDTPEKKAKLEELWIKTGAVSVLDVLDGSKLEVKVEIVDG